MSEVIQKRFKRWLVVGGISLFVLVFAFLGVITPPDSMTGVVAGRVNGDPILLSEYQNALDQQMERLKGFGFPPDQLKNPMFYKQVFDSLVERKLQYQAAEKAGYLPSQDEVRKAIRELPYFQTDGHFDPERYRTLLRSNNLSEVKFEKQISESLVVQKSEQVFNHLIQVSTEEVKQEYLDQNDKRVVSLALLKREAMAKLVPVGSKEIDSYLSEEGKLNIAKGWFESRKDTEYKGKKFDDVKRSIAENLIATLKTKEIEEATKALSAKIVATFDGSKASVERVNALLKPIGAKVQADQKVNRVQDSLPGVGEVRDLIADAFAEPSPIDAKTGKKAKEYDVTQGRLIAVMTAVEKPDPAKFTDQDKVMMEQRLKARKRQVLMSERTKILRERASISMNGSAIGITEPQQQPTDGG